MKSQFGDYFNHDSDAASYDSDVLDESDPIRTGYDSVLNWVVEQGQVTSECHVLDLGSGTGNLSSRIPACAYLTCVDLSEKMTTLARPKLERFAQIEFVQADILDYFMIHSASFDVIMSTYTIHHLTEPEKTQLFEHIWDHLHPGGRAVFGDLMFQDQTAEQKAIQRYREGVQSEVAEDIEEEFFWYVDRALADLMRAGFRVEIKQFSDLSWGIAAKKFISNE